MSILLVGLSHQTAPIELRERLALDECGLRMALDEFHRTYIEPYADGTGAAAERTAEPVGRKTLSECCILSTCNRFEMYVAIPDTGELTVEQSWETVIQFIARLQDINVQELRPHLYLRAEQQAVEHLMRVAAGLDSLVLGEAQILGQVNRAYKESVLTETVGPVLSHLFMRAIHAGKRARTETGISRHTTSVSHAAANLARATLGELHRLHALVVGAGEMARLAAEAIQRQGVGRITVINRTYSSAERLAADVDGHAVVWDELGEMLAQVDLVLSATGAPHVVIHRADVEQAMAQRAGRMLAFFDVALPRDIDEAVHALPGVACYDVDDLQDAVDENLAQRTAEMPSVEAIIAEEVVQFQEWLREREVVPVLVDMRQRAREIAQAEVVDAMRRVRNLAPDAADALEDAVERLAHRLVNKLLHEPTVRLKEHAAAGDGYAYAHAVRDLFALAPPRDPAAAQLNVDTCTACTICTTWPEEESSSPAPLLSAATAPCATRQETPYLVTLAQEVTHDAQ